RGSGLAGSHGPLDAPLLLQKCDRLGPRPRGEFRASVVERPFLPQPALVIKIVEGHLLLLASAADWNGSLATGPEIDVVRLASFSGVMDFRHLAAAIGSRQDGAGDNGVEMGRNGCRLLWSRQQ